MKINLILGFAAVLMVGVFQPAAAQVATFPVNVTVTGLEEGPTPGLPEFSVVLLNNGGDAISVFSDGTFSFPTELQDGADYDVTIAFQPDNQTCTVSDGSGTISGAPATDPLVTCVSNPAPPPAPIPTLSWWGLLLSVFAIMWVSRRRVDQV